MQRTCDQELEPESDEFRIRRADVRHGGTGSGERLVGDATSPCLSITDPPVSARAAPGPGAAKEGT